MDAHIQPETMVAATDRGSLWTASREKRGDRIVRIIDPQFCDMNFRQTLRALRERQYPRTLPIVGEGWAGERFYIEYHVDSIWETLESCFEQLHWRTRLDVMRQICEILPQWSNCPARPLGLDGRNLVMVTSAGRWFPWLLPCPPLNLSSPCDLFKSDTYVIASLAPEIIRDVYSDDRLRDAYALGVLAARALGCEESEQAESIEERIEAQACGALVVCDIRSSSVEDFLRDEPALGELFRVIQHYTQPSPSVRPLVATDLESACANALASTDHVECARERIRRGNPRKGLQMLEWGLTNFGDSVEALMLAVEICRGVEDYAGALRYLERAASALGNQGAFTPDAVEALQDIYKQRCDLRWQLYQEMPPRAAGEPDPEGDALLEDLALLKRLSDTSPERNLPHKMSARIYRRRHDLAAAARELYEAASLEPSDMESLFEYGNCLMELGETDSTRMIVEEAHRRLQRMVVSEMMHETEAQRWREKFNLLSQP
jgi:hypothetical protein